VVWIPYIDNNNVLPWQHLRENTEVRLNNNRNCHIR